jgi:hypothetical protein
MALENAYKDVCHERDLICGDLAQVRDEIRRVRDAL